MNRLLTFLSNIFTDMGLTDMETCYKLFRRQIIHAITIEENRFGFEAEIVCKISQMRCRIYEMPISYKGRTYAEGKKINWKDGVRALYCILHYGAHKAPLPVQFLVYLLIGGTAALFNLILFLTLIPVISVSLAALTAFYAAAFLNYWLCVHLLFTKNIRWRSGLETTIYCLSITGIALADMLITKGLIAMGLGVVLSKLFASGVGLILNFLVRRFLIFPEKPSGEWR